MNGASRVCVLTVLLSFCCVLAKDQHLCLPVGGKLSITPDGVSQEPTIIVWKHGDNLVLEWVQKDSSLLIYSSFKGRSQLNTTTARLEISGLTLTDSGVYSAELNNLHLPDRFNVTVVRKVEKPKIWLTPLTCSDLSPSCKLMCEGIMTDVGLPVFRWRSDAGHWIDGERELEISKNTTNTQQFFCLMKNPVSEEESDGFTNPFFRKPPEGVGATGWRLVLGVGVGVSALALVAFFVFWKRKNINEFLSECKNKEAASTEERQGMKEQGNEKDENAETA
ncbi:hypothetical protein LDENG_00142340 [Lucifuga dentata]|nr:hypothetical protein LDENG_00142340 [Lucifuga dentata]